MRWTAMAFLILSACGGGGGLPPVDDPLPPPPVDDALPRRILFTEVAVPPAGDAYGAVRREGAHTTVYLWAGTPAAVRVRAIAHQLGHAMGAGDSTDFRCVMYPSAVVGEWGVCDAEPEGGGFIVTLGTAVTVGIGFDIQAAMLAWGGSGQIRFTAPGDPPLP
jgi:hypothetical protein